MTVPWPFLLLAAKGLCVSVLIGAGADLVRLNLPRLRLADEGVRDLSDGDGAEAAVSFHKGVVK